MSFGFGIGDVIALGQLAWKVYRSCKDAPESFKNISQEVLSLHAMLREVEENISAQTLPVTRQSNLKTIGDGCRNVLEDLQSLVDSTSQVVVQKKLNKFLQELQDGKREGSVVTTQTVESLSIDEKQTWRIIRKELEDIGITVAAFDANKGFIMDWFREGIAIGAFKEQTLEDISTNQSCKDDLGQFWGDTQYPTTTNQSTTELFNPLNAWNIVSQDPIILNAQSSQTTTTQKAISPCLVFLSTKEPNTSAKTLRTQVTQRAAQKAHTQRKHFPQVAALIAWVLRYNKLINATRQGDVAVMYQLLGKGADVNAKGDQNWTALHWAAHKGHGVAVQLLLEKGADVNAKGNGDKTALHLAADKGHEAVVRLLVEKGADVNAKNNNNWAALHLAALNGHEAAVRQLLEKRADVNAKDDSNMTVLHLAALNGHEAAVRQLLEKGADVNAKDDLNWTALHWAAGIGHEAVVRLLVEKGADVNAKDDSNVTALHWAADNGYEAAVRLLVEKGADVNAKNSLNQTALYLAAKKGHEAVVWLLQPSTRPLY